MIFAALAVAPALSGCGNLQGLGGPSTPLVTFNFVVNGDVTASHLQVALVWGEQWLTEPFCLPTQHPDAAQMVVDQGCRDPFGFVPARVAADVPVTVGVPATISLQDLPSSDLLVGDITSRVAYASLVVYDDRGDGGGAGDGTLDLALPHRLPGAGPGPPQDDTPDTSDIVYGASFLTMVQPDQRIGYLEGTFTPSGFYPRNGCDPPPDGFSVLSAGGFSAADALTSVISGTLPPEATCGSSSHSPDQMITIPIQGPAAAAEAGCMERTDDSSTRYRQPPFDTAPDFTNRMQVCAPLPSFDAGDQPNLTQLVITGRTTDRCMGLTHYTLRGCRNNVACAVPQWDYTANPPSWWPCPQ